MALPTRATRDSPKTLSLAHTEPPRSRGSSLVPLSAKGTEDGNRLGCALCPKLDIDSALTAAQGGIRSGQGPKQ